MANAEKNPILTKAVQGSGAKAYTVRVFDDGTAHCTCPGWQFQKDKPANERVCKHIAKVVKEAMAQQ